MKTIIIILFASFCMAGCQQKKNTQTVSKSVQNVSSDSAQLEHYNKAKILGDSISKAQHKK